MQRNKFTYAEGILDAFNYLLKNYNKCFVIGQGLWSPWYVGSTMKDLDKNFGVERIIDTPVSESATTGAAVGAALSGMLPIVVHPRIDFMLYAMDSIVNQAAKWHHMTGGQASVPLTIRGIINRGGEQGAQHSQALHAWFAHIPGLKVVTPYSATDARDLLIASVLDPNPVIYIDDRWLYDLEAPQTSITEIVLDDIRPIVVNSGTDVTIVASGFSTHLALKASEELKKFSISAEVIDLRVISPIDPNVIFDSLLKTKKLFVIDGGWSSCGLSAEIIALVAENKDLLRSLESLERLTLPFAPAPTSRALEDIYYIQKEDIINSVRKAMEAI